MEFGSPLLDMISVHNTQSSACKYVDLLCIIRHIRAHENHYAFRHVASYISIRGHTDRISVYHACTLASSLDLACSWGQPRDALWSLIDALAMFEGDGTPGLALTQTCFSPLNSLYMNISEVALARIAQRAFSNVVRFLEI
jgi:hypothetical protein